MDSLDLNIRQLILSDLARNIAESPEDDLSPSDRDALLSRTSNLGQQKAGANLNGAVPEPLTISTSRAQCDIAFAEYAAAAATRDAESTSRQLLGLLRELPDVEIETDLRWTTWALPDQVAFAAVTALLQIAAANPEARRGIIDGLVEFTAALAKHLEGESGPHVVTHIVPAFHGLYRAITETPFPWTVSEWSAYMQRTKTLFAFPLVARLNDVLLLGASSSAPDEDASSYAHALLARYRANGRPLSGNFVICGVIETQWVVLAQAIADAPEALQPRAPLPPPSPAAGEVSEAADAAWDALTTREAKPLEHAEGAVRDDLAAALKSAVQCYDDLLGLLDKLNGEPPSDIYSFEIMSESLKLATLCTTALRSLDSGLLSRLKLLLSESTPVTEALVQETALQVMSILAINFPLIAMPMTAHLRRFVTAPLDIFEAEVTDASGTPVLSAAAHCLATCIKIAPGEDLIMSTMYSLLNYLSAPSRDASGAASIRTVPAGLNYDQQTVGMHTRSLDQKKRISMSTIAVVTKLALDFNRPEITNLTISMLLQRLQGADPIAEAAILSNLVDLALIADVPAFMDVVKAFSEISMSANPEDPTVSSNAVITAQTRLARNLGSRTDCCDVYLHELLTLFAEKGMQVQIVSAQCKDQDRASDLTGNVAALLLAIDALLAHPNFNPHAAPSPDLVSLFRNMWFLCVLFGFTPQSPTSETPEWQRASLARITLKTPALVLEGAQNTLDSDLEYNSILRRDFSAGALAHQRSVLTSFIPKHAHEIRSFTLAQVTFLLTIYHVERMRSELGKPSMILWYFVNEAINSSPLISCMETIADQVSDVYIATLSKQAVEQSVDPNVAEEVKRLLVGSCHRLAKVRDVSFKYANRLVTTFPAFMCEPTLVVALLEAITLLRRACDGEVLDEYSPVFEFHSEKAQITLELTDSYAVRNEILTRLHQAAREWLGLGLTHAPVEVQGILETYLDSSDEAFLPGSVEMGASIALDFASSLPRLDRKSASLPPAGGWKADASAIFANRFSLRSRANGEIIGVRLALNRGLHEMHKVPDNDIPREDVSKIKEQMADVLRQIRGKTGHLTMSDLQRLLWRCAGVLVASNSPDHDLLHHLVSVPFRVFTPLAMSCGRDAWTWLIGERPDLEAKLMVEITSEWLTSIRCRRGMFSGNVAYKNPFNDSIEYSPTNKDIMDQNLSTAKRVLGPHKLLIQMLSSRFQAIRYSEDAMVISLTRLLFNSARAHKLMSTHPLAREVRFSLLLLGFQVLQNTRTEGTMELRLRQALYDAAFSWFSVRPQWSYGSDRTQVEADIRLLQDFLGALRGDTLRTSRFVTSFPDLRPRYALPGATFEDVVAQYKERRKLLDLLVENEIHHLSVWTNPLSDPRRGADAVSLMEKGTTDDSWIRHVRTAWLVQPAVAVHMAERFKVASVRSEVTKLVRQRPNDAIDIPEALEFLIGEQLDPSVKKSLKSLLFWAPVPPVSAINYFHPRYRNDPLILQYAMRVLEQHPVDLTFFYVPQIVQALRHDGLGYVERFIFETAKISQLFCHQIIWNMKANTYKDDNAEVPDPMKPLLDRMIDMIVAALSGEAQEFYDREFGFFDAVTSISGKLKPYVKKSKPEKKAKIDEEMAKIEVKVGVYLPSNPDGVVVDIDKKSGRPLQSHAKAPFMATFQVRKEKTDVAGQGDDSLEADEKRDKHTYEVWQAAIFKVGDDCRQDVLALQAIAMFKNIFTSVGLVLYLNPYRVTATGPGCGVIDVVPNATSRDEMGRAKINDLFAFFVRSFGHPDSIKFQHARLNFIQSMAAYSLVCYILQVKDRHNGNIMIDGEGHIVHIDFGFLFDIDEYLFNLPSWQTKLIFRLAYLHGVKFEPNSFKLSHEMVVVMGGRDSPGYRMFVELCVKGFLAIRMYADQIVDAVHLMLGTDLPSFKGEGTIHRLRERFQLQLSDRAAAQYMVGIVRNAHENTRSVAYDEFQRLTNGIPYAV